MPHRKYISVVFSPDGGGQSVSIRIRKWLLWFILAGVFLSWLFLFFDALGFIFYARLVSNQRELMLENRRLRTALSKADSLSKELSELHSLRKLMEKAFLVSQKRYHEEQETQKQYLPDWIPQKSVFLTNKRGLPEVTEYLESIERKNAYIPRNLPVQGIVSAGFGERGGVFKSSHTGVDIIARTGSPVYAVADGIVAHIGENGEYGIFMEIDHLNGYRTLYAHLRDVVVSKGAPVCRGTVIAHTGETGRTIHPHLHYEVSYLGKLMDPLTLVDTELANFLGQPEEGEKDGEE